MKSAVLKIFVIVFVLFLFPLKQAFSLDEETKALCNQVMMSVYKDIEEQKSKFPELDNFSNAALSVNPYGIYAIQYKYLDQLQPANNQIFEFGVTIIGINDLQAFA